MLEPVLFIAYQFPPQGGPGVQRVTRFVNEIRSYGFEPIILTRDLKSIKSGNYPMDESLNESLPKDLKIIRVKSNEGIHWRRRLMKLKLYGLFWYVFYRWNWENSLNWSQKALTEATEIIKENKIRIIYTTSAPFSSLILAQKLKEKTGVKWVADIRDPWTDAFTWRWPSKYHWEKAVALEKKTLADADHIIVVTTEMKKMFLSNGIGSNETIKIIYNGF